jgi:hypothetical protein
LLVCMVSSSLYLVSTIYFKSLDRRRKYLNFSDHPLAILRNLRKSFCAFREGPATMLCSQAQMQPLFLSDLPKRIVYFLENNDYIVNHQHQFITFQPNHKRFPMIHTTYNIQHTTYNIQLTTYNLQLTTYNLQRSQA